MAIGMGLASVAGLRPVPLHCGESMECIELKHAIAAAVAAPPAPPLPPPTAAASGASGWAGYAPANIVRRRLPPPTSGPARIQVNCPQHSACTWFLSVLCSHMRKPRCLADWTRRSDCWAPVEPPRPGQDYVAKTTILPWRTLDAWREVERAAAAGGSPRMYRVLFIRNPLATYSSLRLELSWRENCGGFVNKLAAYDAWVARAIAHDEYYDALVFAENVFRSPANATRELGLADAVHWATTPPRRTRTRQSLSRTGRAADGSPSRDEALATRALCRVTPFLCALYRVGYDPSAPRPEAAPWELKPNAFSAASDLSEAVAALVKAPLYNATEVRQWKAVVRERERAKKEAEREARAASKAARGGRGTML